MKQLWSCWRCSVFFCWGTGRLLTKQTHFFFLTWARSVVVTFGKFSNREHRWLWTDGQLLKDLRGFYHFSNGLHPPTGYPAPLQAYVMDSINFLLPFLSFFFFNCDGSRSSDVKRKRIDEKLLILNPLGIRCWFQPCREHCPIFWKSSCWRF